jgi:hypothetical protein
MGLLDVNPFARPVPAVEPEPDPWVRVLAAIDQLRAAIAEAPAAPAPVVQVEPVDLSEVVMAVQALKGPATAEDIAHALAAVLRRDPDPPATTGDVMTEVVDALKRLDFRLKGGGGNMMGAGGGSVQFSPQGLRELEAAITAANASATVTPVVATVTASGDTTVHTPAAGKAIRLHWISAINDPDEEATPLVKVKLGATELYRAYAVAHRQTFEGAADAALVVNLSAAASIAFTAHIEEFTP